MKIGVLKFFGGDVDEKLTRWSRIKEKDQSD